MVFIGYIIFSELQDIIVFLNIFFLLYLEQMSNHKS